MIEVQANGFFSQRRTRATEEGDAPFPGNRVSQGDGQEARGQRDRVFARDVEEDGRTRLAGVDTPGGIWWGGRKPAGPGRAAGRSGQGYRSESHLQHNRH